MQVGNIERATAFYRALLGVDGTRVSVGRHHFSCGGVTLACHDPRADGGWATPEPNAGEACIAVDDLDDTYARARAAGCKELESKIRETTLGERAFFARDPFGNALMFVDGKTTR
jgi:predicted enzyme related to lactoylglutathione lyase